MKKDKQSYTKFCLKLNDITDSDIIDALWSVENKTDYIRKLIRDDLAICAYSLEASVIYACLEAKT